VIGERANLMAMNQLRVWLVTRPLSFLPTTTTSDGRHLRHWGVLVSSRTLLDIKILLDRTLRSYRADDPDLGTLFELHVDGKMTTVSITQPFRLSTLQDRWPSFLVDYVGETNATHELIKAEGSFKLRVQGC
jgi:hypothetical protein